MRILFFCGSLAPGRDGVGDYTRRLADACTARGHDCMVIALHDPEVSRVTQLTPGKVHHVRLPATAPWPDRLAWAGRHLLRFEADWVSWQLVAYALQARGFLPAALLRAAPRLRGPRCHVMMHELWIGLESGARWRARGLGWLQRRGILCLLHQIGPDRLHTSNAAYQQALAREGFKAGLLRLFSNVPIAGEPFDCAGLRSRWLPAGGNPLVALTFGTLHPQWQPRATVDWLRATAQRLGRPPALIAAGRGGSHATAILDAFRAQGVPVGETGELDEATLSLLLQAADLGLAPHPWALIGKSGAAAAMLEHGLPVLVPRDDWQLRGMARPVPGPTDDPLLVRLAGLDETATDRWLARRRPPAPALPEVTDAFLTSLEDSPCHP